jgi:hypothetical protein
MKTLREVGYDSPLIESKEAFVKAMRKRGVRW